MTTNYLIIYNRVDEENESSLFGFKLFTKDEAAQFIKCVKLLSQDNASFSSAFGEITYCEDDFIKSKICSTDIKVLHKIFDLPENDDKSGVFPDAIMDAYDYNLIDDSDEDEAEFDDDL